jgi:hypothetical protein
MKFALFASLLAFPGALLMLRAQEELPDGEGKNVVERVCTECHGTDEITSIKRTPDQWRRIVKDMLDRRETKTSDEEAKQIIEYLIAHFSRPDGVQARDDLSVRIIHKDGVEAAHSLRKALRRPEKRCSGLSSPNAAWGPQPHALSQACAAFFVRSVRPAPKAFLRERACLDRWL